jgi:hypothetical protein
MTLSEKYSAAYGSKTGVLKNFMGLCKKPESRLWRLVPPIIILNGHRFSPFCFAKWGKMMSIQNFISPT